MKYSSYASFLQYEYSVLKMRGLNMIVSSEKGVSCLFFSRRTAYIVRDNAKNLHQ